MYVERLAQSETYYPMYQEPDTGVTAVAFGIRRFSDGYWYDFNDTTFKNTGWTTKHQALAEDDDGLWTYDTGLAMPDSNEVYSIQFKVTDASGTFYTQGPKIIVNSNLLDVLADWVNGGRLDLILDELTSQGDTNEGKIDTVDTVVDAIKAVTDNLPNSGALSDIDTGVNNIEAKLPSKSYLSGSADADGGIDATEAAVINAEVLDVLNTDTFAEPGQEAPAATTTLIKKIGYLYKFLRNKIDNDGSAIQVYADDGSTVDQKSTVSESAGTVTRGEFGSGP